MNKILGLTLSILFIFEIFLIGMPLATQAATLPQEGQGYAYYLSQYSTVVFVFNVNNIKLSQTNLSTLAGEFANYFNVLLNFNGTTYKLPISNLVGFYDNYIYVAYNPSTNEIEYVIILADVIGSNSNAAGTYVSTSDVEQQLGITNLLITDYADYIFGAPPPNSLYSMPVISNAPSSIQGYITNPNNAAPYFFTEYISGYISSTISIASVSIPAGYTTNSVLVFAPFKFVSPLFIPTQEATGFFNPLQLSGALGPAMKSKATTKPYIWGRALINTSIIDPFVYQGQDQLTFQLNYSVPGYLQINMAQLGYIASVTNYPSSFTYLSYRFANGYISFLGFITDGDNITLTINGKTYTAPVSGYIKLYDPPSGKILTYNVTLIAITSVLSNGTKLPKNGTVVEYFSNLTVYYYMLYDHVQQLLNVQAYHLSSQPNNYTLPVYGYNASAGSKITISGVFNGTPATVTVTVGSTPTLTYYTVYTNLLATAYEGINAVVNSYYTTSPILSTPPSSLAIKGTTSFQDAGNLYSQYATATLTLLTNATLTFNKVKLPGFSFAGLVVTPAYPLINGTSVMQYMGTAQYNNTNGEYQLLIAGSQIAMQAFTYNKLLNLQQVENLGPFSNTLLSPSVPATETGSGPLTLEFAIVPQYAYIALVDFGIWSNQTSVLVQAWSSKGQMLTLNKGYFYATIIPPRISTSKITPQSFVCYNAPSVYIYDPDAILVPYNSTGSFTYNVSLLIYNGQSKQGAIVFYGPTLYSVGGTFGTNTFSSVPTGTLVYQLKPISSVNNQISAYQLVLKLQNGETVYPLNSSTSYASLLQYYADNNPTVNFYFEQANYAADLNVSYSTMTLAPQNQIGYAWIYPKNIPNNATYNITNYITFKVLSSYAPALLPAYANAIVTVTPNASFVGATDYYMYISTDYAVYHYFKSSNQYKVQTQVTVPNITAALYFANSVTPLYTSYAKLYFNETYYGANLPTYLSLGTNGPLTWNSPNYNLFGIYATPLYLAKMVNVNVTLPSGTKYTILLTTNNITTLFASLNAQQLQYCNGTYEFDISIPGLESILGLNAQQLNGSTLTVSVYDYVTHETLVASTKLVALSGLTPVAITPGEVFYFLTFKASNVILTASTPWFIATSMYMEPALNITDLQYGKTNPSSILSLSITSITVFHDGYKAMMYYDAKSGRTIVVNVYGQVVANYSGNLLPTMPETAPASGVFTGQLPFKILQNNTVLTLNVNNITIYVNGTLAIQLSNGSVVPLGPAAYFVLPFVTYQGKQVGYVANVTVTVTDGISSATLKTYLAPANITPIRLAPIPTIPPIPKAPVGNYYYSKPVTVTPTNPVINIYATSVLPYPYEFFIVAIVRPGVNASTAAPVVYYSYQAVVAKPALGSSLQPYIEVAVQMSGILSLPPGTYTVQMYAVPFAQGPVISEYPVSIIFTNVTIQ